MRALTRDELLDISGGLINLPPVTVTATPTGGGGGWYPEPDPPAPSDPIGGGGGNSHSSSPTFGNLLPPTDTPTQRASVVHQAEDILEDLGYDVPPDFGVNYYDHYIFKDTDTGTYRFSDSNAINDHEKAVYGYTRPDGSIVISKFAVIPYSSPDLDNGSLVSWHVLEDDKGNPSMTGKNEGLILDGGIDALESTISTLAHEIYHADQYETDKNHKTSIHDELEAQTQGFLAERAFTKAVLEGK